MKRGFTLIEMLIVVALIATLMTIVLRLSSVGADEEARNTTVIRLAKLENCLSGYYAAYGSYPPVRLHNSRDITLKVDSAGRQPGEDGEALWGWDVKTFLKDMKAKGYSTQREEITAWNQVRAACESQPVALEAPAADVDGMDEAIENLVQIVQQNMSSGEFPNYPKDAGDRNYYAWKNGFSSIYQNLGGIDDEISWRHTQICKFGLMSFLLPRYQTMMGWRDVMFDGKGNCRFEQWNANNGDVPHDPYTGEALTWKKINEKVREANGQNGESDSGSRTARAYVEALPSEAVTARWLPNLSGICFSDMDELTFFGVTISSSDWGGMFEVSANKKSSPPSIRVYSPDPKNPGRNCYHLCQITVHDGWGTEFFYYSPTPHQSYQLWSAGKNKRTFPPWVSRKGLDSKANACVAAWTEDDIRGLKN